MKFKDISALMISEEFNRDFESLRVLKKTYIKNLVDRANNEKQSKQELINLIVDSVNYMLDLMIEEEGNR